MKKTLLISLLACIGLLNAFAADVFCYGDDEKNQEDWWLDHQYFAVCTDYEGSGSKIFSGNEDYIDFNSGSSVDFTDIYVPEDGEYTVTLWYGVGFADASGATLTVNVNGEFFDQLIFYSLSSDPPATMEFDVELWGNYDNTIQLVQVKDWPLIYAIQLTEKESSGTALIKDGECTIAASDGSISISGLTANSQIAIYSVTGKLVEKSIAGGANYTTTLSEGLYIVNIDGKAYKALVK